MSYFRGARGWALWRHGRMFRSVAKIPHHAKHRGLLRGGRRCRGRRLCANCASADGLANVSNVTVSARIPARSRYGRHAPSRWGNSASSHLSTRPKLRRLLRPLFLLDEGWLSRTGESTPQDLTLTVRSTEVVLGLLLRRPQTESDPDAVFTLPNGESGVPQVLHVLRRGARASLRLRLRQRRDRSVLRGLRASNGARGGSRRRSSC